MTASSPDKSLPLNTTEVLAATIAGAVERQLTQYISAMAQQVDAARQEIDASRAELRAEFQGQLHEILTRIDGNQQRAESAQQALQTALEGRLNEFAQHQHARLNEAEERMLAAPGGNFTGSVDAGEIIALREHIDAQSAGAHARIDDLHKSARRFDEQTSALVQHVNDTTVALTQRMDEGNQALASAVEERLGFVRTTLEAVSPEVTRQLADHATALTQRLDFTEHKITDRMLAMEDRINEQNGVKIAALEAAVGRIGSGFDDAMVALSQRMLELENRLAESVLRLDIMDRKVDSIDESGINAVKDQLSSAVGEVMLVRIELDRVVANTDDKVNKATLRMAEIESLLQDEMDVSTTVQLERLDELERAIAILDPAQLVRKDELAGGGAAAPAPAALTPSLADVTAPLLRPTSPQMPGTSLGQAPTKPAEPSLSSF
ncbi:MAG: hypothetical protein Q7V57_17085 [Actinomycetota bacterium]|nr:hypothetical protein [Actinomycetota bacterium]